VKYLQFTPASIKTRPYFFPLMSEKQKNFEKSKMFPSVITSSMSGSVLFPRQLSPEDFQQLLAWYKVRDSLLGQNEQEIKKALELGSVCDQMLSG
jgi:hypothetical protein